MLPIIFRGQIFFKIPKNFISDYDAGEIIEHLPGGTPMLRNSCYQTNLSVRGGASGGPVIDQKTGHVIGINSTSFNLSEPPEISFISDIREIFKIPIVEELCKLGQLSVIN